MLRILREKPRFLGYAWIPLISGLTWIGGLLALLGIWAARGKPRYKNQNQAIVYISDIGAHEKALFIVICCVTGSTFALSLVIDRLLRHKNRLSTLNRKKEKIFSYISIFFGIVGAIALILLSIFDDVNHDHLHWSFTCVFIVTVALSAITQTIEYKWLKKDNPDLRRLQISYTLKVVFAVTAVGTAIAMAVLSFTHHSSAAAVTEWTIAFLFAFYVLVMVYDLRPAVSNTRGYGKYKHNSAYRLDSNNNLQPRKNKNNDNNIQSPETNGNEMTEIV